MSFVIRVTAKLAKRLKEPLVASTLPSTGIFGDWYANLLYLQRQQIILAVSESTLLPLLIPAKDAKPFPKRLRASLAELLTRLNIPTDKIEKELAKMSSAIFAETASRQVLGSTVVALADVDLKNKC